MSIAYLLPTLPPKSEKAEAIAQEIALLRRNFGGEVLYVNPNATLKNVAWGRTLIPRAGFGWHVLPALRKVAQKVDLFHFFNPDPFPYPFLLALPKPVVYTITTGIETRPNLPFFRRMAMVTVADERAVAKLQGWGLQNVAWQRPGIDASRFTHHPLPLPPDQPLRRSVASAPWTAAQFQSKGFDALLAAAQRVPDLRLTLLWRGLMVEEIQRRIAEWGVGERVTVIDEIVDVNQLLASVHAAAIFATASGILKSYPHSLLDALAAGKPVLLSNTLALADYVNREQCGIVVETVTAEAIVAGLAQLRAGYATYAHNAELVGKRDFSEEAALSAARAIYAAVRNEAKLP